MNVELDFLKMIGKWCALKCEESNVIWVVCTGVEKSSTLPTNVKCILRVSELDKVCDCVKNKKRLYDIIAIHQTVAVVYLLGCVKGNP